MDELYHVARYNINHIINTHSHTHIYIASANHLLKCNRIARKAENTRIAWIRYLAKNKLEFLNNDRQVFTIETSYSVRSTEEEVQGVRPTDTDVTQCKTTD